MVSSIAQRIKHCPAGDRCRQMLDRMSGHDAARCLPYASVGELDDFCEAIPSDDPRPCKRNAAGTRYCKQPDKESDSTELEHGIWRQVAAAPPIDDAGHAPDGQDHERSNRQVVA